MLAEARRKAVYGDLREATLGEELDYESGGYDGVLASGVLTTGHAPATCLDELVRITRPEGTSSSRSALMRRSAGSRRR